MPLTSSSKSTKVRLAYGAADATLAVYGRVARPFARIVARRFRTPVKLHLGSGLVYLDGWVNIDWQPTAYSVLTRGKRPDVSADLARGVPFPRAVATHVYSNNFMEHLEPAAAHRCLAEALRVLQPGGRIRIVVPDVARYLRAYTEGDAAFFAQLTGASDYWPELRTPMEYVATVIHGAAAHGWSHYWAYDFETLSLYLQDAGFLEIERFDVNESSDEVLRNLDGGVFACLAVEAVAP